MKLVQPILLRAESVTNCSIIGTHRERAMIVNPAGSGTIHEGGGWLHALERLWPCSQANNHVGIS